MARELERRFLVASDAWRLAARSSSVIVQAYLMTGPGRAARVRLRDGKAFLTLKFEDGGPGVSEFEYPVPPDDARRMVSMALGCVIEKIRSRVDHDGRTVEVDEFAGPLSGLVIAEVEFAEGEDPASFAPPPWFGREITGEREWSNASLALSGMPGSRNPG